MKQVITMTSSFSSHGIAQRTASPSRRYKRSLKTPSLQSFFFFFAFMEHYWEISFSFSIRNSKKKADRRRHLTVIRCARRWMQRETAVLYGLMITGKPTIRVTSQMMRPPWPYPRWNSGSKTEQYISKDKKKKKWYSHLVNHITGWTQSSNILWQKHGLSYFAKIIYDSVFFHLLWCLCTKIFLK